MEGTFRVCGHTTNIQCPRKIENTVFFLFGFADTLVSTPCLTLKGSVSRGD